MVLGRAALAIGLYTRFDLRAGIRVGRKSCSIPDRLRDAKDILQTNNLSLLPPA